MSITIEFLWKDRKRYFGLPLSFTRYSLSEDRLFTSVGFLNIKDDEILLYGLFFILPFKKENVKIFTESGRSARLPLH